MTTLARTPTYVIGNDWDIDVACFQNSGAVFDLTGCTVRFTLKERRDRSGSNTRALAAYTWIDGPGGAGINVTDKTHGVLTVTVPASVTATARRGLPYAYDVVVTSSTGKPKTMVVVEFTPDPGVTSWTAPPP
jgi:hypothetical protein